MKVERIKQEVAELLGDGHGHGFDHVTRVATMAISFAQQENADIEIVELAALLHDVDDYKLFGEDAAKNLSKASAILEKHDYNGATKKQVLSIIGSMGYNKYLEGIRPNTIEGMVVSDADMCDAIGAEGILRTHAYALSKGNEFFDLTLPPENPTTDASNYRKDKKNHSVQHFFDKLLIIPTIMLTNAGKEEAEKREAIMISFLEELFRENQAEEWQAHLQDNRTSQTAS